MTMFMIFIQLLLVCWYNGGLDSYDNDIYDAKEDDDDDDKYSSFPLLGSVS